jgi:hypothetical protein
MYPRILFNWLFQPLRPLEKMILSAVEAQLGPSLAHLLRAQVREINYVQRRLGGREVGLYVIRAGRVNRNESLRLPTTEREWRLARVRLGKKGSKWIASVHIADGHLSSIEYDSPPPAADADLNVSVELLAPASRVRQSSGSVPMLLQWLQPYADRFGVTDLEPPLTADDRAALIDQLESTLPDDYIDFVANCDGVQIGTLSLAGLSEAYEARAVDTEYVVLGQLNGHGALAVRKPGPMIVFMNYEDGSIRELGHSLQAAIERVMPFLGT